MTDFKDKNEMRAGEGAETRFEPVSQLHYDPLFKPWQEAADIESPGQATSDPLGAGWVRSKSAGATTHGDAISWGVPAASPYRASSAAYPDRYQPPYAGRLSRLDQRMGDGTIALPRPERRWLVTIREAAETLLLAALIFLAVRASFQNFRVEGASMTPSLLHGEYLIVNKLSYAEIDMSVFDFLPFYEAGENDVHHLWGSPSRGDVIVFRAPTSVSRDFIKRIIGVPGDAVSIEEGTGVVSVNGQPLTEPYINGMTGCGASCSWTIPQARSSEALAECGSSHCYFVMGDNRQNSSDSRQGWLVPEENIVGKALITYWHDGAPDVDFAPNRSVGIVDEAVAEQ